MSDHYPKIKEQVFNLLKYQSDPRLTYHDAQHTANVLAAVEEYAALEGLSPEKADFTRLAALFHDLGYICLPEEENEHVSALYCRDILKEHGYPEEAIEKVCAAIMATRMPQKPREEMERILCDADLDYLGRDDFFQINELFGRERANLGEACSERRNLERARDFLAGHRYFTASANALRGEGKKSNLKLVLDRLQELNGDH